MHTKQRSLNRELRTAVSGNYFLQLPTDLIQEGSSFPLLIFLHGMAQQDYIFDLAAPPKMKKDGDDFPCAIATPVCNEVRWSCDIVLALIEELSERYAIDRDRIYLTGISIGGMATWHTALRNPDLFAAIVPVCGAGDPWNAFRISDVPCWAFHGRKDSIVPVEVTESMLKAIIDSGGNPKVTIYEDGGHRIWDRVYQTEELWQWLFSQAKGRNRQ